MIPYEQALGNGGQEKLPFTGRNLRQNQVQEGAVICHDWLGGEGQNKT